MSHYLHSFLRFFIVVVAVVAVVISLYYVSTLTYPFLIALAIAFFINPLVNLLERKAKLPRALAVIIVLICLLALVAGLVTLLVAEIVTGTQYLATVVPSHFQKLVVYIEQFVASQLIPLYNQLATLFKNLDTAQQDTIVTNIQSVGTKVATTVGRFIQDILQNIPSIIGWLPNFATIFIFSLLATFFISKDWYRLSAIFQKLLPNKVQTSSAKVLAELKKALFGFIKAQATLVSITTLIVLVGLLVLQVKYAITIALIIGIVDLLPYLGTGLVFVPWIIYAAMSGNAHLAVGLSVLYLVIIVQRQVMEPKLLSSNIGLDPLATLVALFVGFQLFGFLGLILGPVLLVIVRTLHHAGIFYDAWNFIVGKKA